MKAMIASAILVFGILGCTTLGERQAQEQAIIEQMSWLDTCQLLIDYADYHCARLMPPYVIYEDMRDGLYGYYDGSDTIYVSNELTRVETFETLIHETIHYVHVQLQLIEVPGYSEPICWSENEAWMLTGIYYNENNDNWWRAYPHCWQYYANTQDLQDLGVIWSWINDIVDDYIWEN